MSVANGANVFGCVILDSQTGRQLVCAAGRGERPLRVFDYIERFYNPRRWHSTIGYRSPVEFEEQMRLA